MNEEYFDLEEFESGRPWLDREGVAWTFERMYKLDELDLLNMTLEELE